MLQTTVDFLRHGEVSGGLYYRGRTDDLLTKQGLQHMKSTVDGHSWNQIVTSPLHRCLDFAQHLNTQTNIPYIIEDNWQEINFGDWEGKKADQINPNALTLFYQDPINNPPQNAENFQVFLSRIEKAWENLISTQAGKHVLVITHSGVIRCIFNTLLNLPIENTFNLQIDYASITRFQCIHDDTGNFIKLVYHNWSHQSLTTGF